MTQTVCTSGNQLQVRKRFFCLMSPGSKTDPNSRDHEQPTERVIIFGLLAVTLSFCLLESLLAGSLTLVSVMLDWALAASVA